MSGSAVTVARSLAGGQDTIVALSTPPGRGAISVVRLSGPHAFRIARQLVQKWPLEPRRVTLCQIIDVEHGDILDQALVTTFVSPNSFTGEDMVEVSGHGGNYGPALLINALISCGARQAQPGEFTRRAVLNGKLDITQAEAIGDVADARSSVMHRVALNQLDGGLSRRISALRNQIIELESLIAYDIDFPEEDHGAISRTRVQNEVEKLIESLDALLGTIPMGEVIRAGATVVIAGPPNVGKSSLFNALLGQSRAIVTEIPGTTRDAIEAALETEHWPIRLVDTAGLRKTGDKVEQIGVQVSEGYLKRAQVVLSCADTDESLAPIAEEIRKKTDAAILRLRTKIDLNTTADPTLTGRLAELCVSAETGEGIPELLAGIDSALSGLLGGTAIETPVLMRNRQIQGIREARSEMVEFEKTWLSEELPVLIAAVHLRAAVTALESLIGGVSSDDILDRVFSSFCVGK